MRGQSSEVLSDKRLTIILHSGDWDKVNYALSIAQAAAMSGMEAHILLVYGALKRFIKGGGLEELGEETPPQVRADIRRALESGALPPLGERLSDVKELGVKIYACTQAMAALEIRRQDLRDEIDEPMGLFAFLELARTACINLYI